MANRISGTHLININSTFSLVIISVFFFLILRNLDFIVVHKGYSQDNVILFFLECMIQDLILFYQVDCLEYQKWYTVCYPILPNRLSDFTKFTFHLTSTPVLSIIDILICFNNYGKRNIGNSQSNIFNKYTLKFAI